MILHPPFLHFLLLNYPSIGSLHLRYSPTPFPQFYFSASYLSFLLFSFPSCLLRVVLLLAFLLSFLPLSYRKFYSLCSLVPLYTSCLLSPNIYSLPLSYPPPPPILTLAPKINSLPLGYPQDLLFLPLGYPPELLFLPPSQVVFYTLPVYVTISIL